MPVRDPDRMSNTWSTGWIKFRSWVTSIKVLPRSRHALARSLATLWAFSSSRLPTGSSARMSAGSLTRARAIATRCCSPPLNSEVPGAIAKTDRVEQLSGAPEIRSALRQHRHKNVLDRCKLREQVIGLEDEPDALVAIERCRGP